MIDQTVASQLDQTPSFDQHTRLKISIVGFTIAFFSGVVATVLITQIIAQQKKNTRTTTIPTLSPTQAIQSATPTPTDTFKRSAGTMQLYSISPTSGPIGTQVILKGIGFKQTKNTINFGIGIGSGYPNYSSPDGTTLTFVIPAHDNPKCPDTVPRCPIRAPDGIEPGNYPISVSTIDGTTKELTFTVTQ